MATDVPDEVARELEVGQVKINGVRTRERPAVPFGGMKNSGYGRELGAVGLAEFDGAIPGALGGGDEALVLQ